MNIFINKHIFILLSYSIISHAFFTREKLQEFAIYAVQNDQLSQALELYTNLANIDPLDARMSYNCGFVQTRLNNNRDAINNYHKTLLLTPDNHLAKLGLSKALLACGEYEKAWPLFEHRLAQIDLIHEAFGYIKLSPLLCKGKKIFLRSEWGLGDMMHFVRYAKLLHHMGAHVIIQAFEPLIPLFSHCDYIDRVITIGDPIPPCDVQIPMMSLPLIFNTILETIPAPIPYLRAKQELVEQWKLKLAHDTLYKIGICWHAKPIYLEDHITTRRSIPLTLFAPLKDLPVSLYSLQKEYGMDEVHSFKGIHPIEGDFDATHGRFMDTAALIMNMDLIISADTSIVHLAGALGKEVWVLLPYAPEWRWLPNVPGYETKTPWYPSMRLFRQQHPGNWDEVIAEVKKDLARRIKACEHR